MGFGEDRLQAADLAYCLIPIFMKYYSMASSENSSFISFLLISAVVVCLGYLVISKFLTESVSKANPKPQMEELTSTMEALRSAQSASIAPSGATTPLKHTPINSAADNTTQDLQSQLKMKEQQRNEMMRTLKVSPDK